MCIEQNVKKNYLYYRRKWRDTATNFSTTATVEIEGGLKKLFQQ